MTNDQLLPCPLCGGEQVTTAPDREFGDVTWDVICKVCGCSVRRDHEDAAITAWNSRTPSHGRVSDSVAMARAIASAYNPGLFDGDDDVKHRAASPHTVAHSQGVELGLARKAAQAVLALSTPPQTVAAPIPVEGEVIQADIRHLAAILEEWDMKEPPNAWTGHSYEAIAADALTRIAAHRRAFSGGVDEVREALETAIGRLAWTACANPGVRHRDGRKLVEGWVAEGRAVLDALSTIEEPRG